MRALAPLAPKIQPLIRMLGSESDGEALAAVRALNRTLKSIGCDFHDLAQAFEPERPQEPVKASPSSAYHGGPPIWFIMSNSQKAYWLNAIANHLEEGTRAQDFALSLLDQLRAGRKLSSRQASCAQSMIDRAWREGVRP